MIIIPEIFKSNDIIYHYTKTSIAVEHICYKNQIRLSPRVNSIDPIEKKGFWMGREFIGTNSELFERILKENEADALKIEENIDRKVRTAKQLCFCENYFPENYKLQNFFPKDFYGFLKPRMWDQYGDNYKGICLAFSKQAILKDSRIKYERKVEYVKYTDLENNFTHINLNSLNNIGYEKYNKNITKLIDDTFFQKHKDYQDENEYRLLKFSHNEYEYLNISNSIRGIIISPELIDNEFIFHQITKYAIKMKIELLYLTWDKNGVKITSKDWLKT